MEMAARIMLARYKNSVINPGLCLMFPLSQRSQGLAGILAQLDQLMGSWWIRYPLLKCFVQLFKNVALLISTERVVAVGRIMRKVTFSHTFMAFDACKKVKLKKIEVPICLKN